MPTIAQMAKNPISEISDICCDLKSWKAKIIPNKQIIKSNNKLYPYIDISKTNRSTNFWLMAGWINWRVYVIINGVGF